MKCRICGKELKGQKQFPIIWGCAYEWEGTTYKGHPIFIGGHGNYRGGVIQYYAHIYEDETKSEDDHKRLTHYNWISLRPIPKEIGWLKERMGDIDSGGD